jgi:simple sugar transport system permease protein
MKRFIRMREGSIIVVTVALGLYFTLTTPDFATVANFKNLLPYFTPFAILAAGEIFLLINGEIDLSIGGVYLLAPVLFYEIAGGGIPLVVSVILTLMICMAVGVVNGLIRAFLGVNSFIATLGMLFTLSGLALIISHAEELVTPGSTVTSNPVTGAVSVGTFANVFGAGTYSELIWALVIVVGLHVALIRTRWGRHTVAIGSNRIAAAEAGVRVRLVLVRNFVICSTCAGIVGILEAVRTTAIEPDPGAAGNVLLQTIAAAVIGGTLLIGGAGTVVGALIGALFLGILQDGLAIVGVNADYNDFYFGLAILFAMLINVYVGKVRGRAGLG